MFHTSIPKFLPKSSIRWKSVPTCMKFPLENPSQKKQHYQIIKPGTVSPELPVPLVMIECLLVY